MREIDDQHNEFGIISEVMRGLWLQHPEIGEEYPDFDDERNDVFTVPKPTALRLTGSDGKESFCFTPTSVRTFFRPELDIQYGYPVDDYGVTLVRLGNNVRVDDPDPNSWQGCDLLLVKNSDGTKVYGTNVFDRESMSENFGGADFNYGPDFRMISGSDQEAEGFLKQLTVYLHQHAVSSYDVDFDPNDL